MNILSLFVDASLAVGSSDLYFVALSWPCFINHILTNHLLVLVTLPLTESVACIVSLVISEVFYFALPSIWCKQILI